MLILWSDEEVQCSFKDVWVYKHLSSSQVFPFPSPKSKAAFNFMANKTRVLFPLKDKSCNIFEDFSATLIADTLIAGFTLDEYPLYETPVLQPLYFLFSSFLPVGVWL